MKKSEMLKIIEETIWKSGGSSYNIQPKHLTVISNKVLEAVESRGMLPPVVTTYRKVKCLFGAWYMEASSQLNKWSKEE